MDPATISAGLALGNGGYSALTHGATGGKSILRRLRLAGSVEVEWLNLGGGDALTASQTIDLRLFLGSDRIRPLLSMTAFAMASTPETAGLKETLKQTFTSEAQRWSVDHRAGWEHQVHTIWGRIVEIYDGALGSVQGADDEIQDELRNFTTFLATPLAERLSEESPTDFGSRLAQLVSDIDRVATVSRTTRSVVTQIHAARHTQPISTLPQSDIYAAFDELYVGRTFLDDETGAPIASEEAMLAGFPFRAVLLGSPGAGKSTFVRHLVRRASDESQLSVPVPALEIRCREYVRAGWGRSIAGYVLTLLDSEFGVQLRQDELEDLLLLGRAIVIFDGLDEVTDHTQRVEMVGRIQAFSSRFPAISTLTTTREVGYDRAPISRTLATHVRLEEFSDTQIEEYAGRWFTVTNREHLRQDFMNDSDSIADIRRNPLLLSLLCMLYREPGAIPLNRRDIYSKCADELFHRWDTHRQIQQNESMPEHGDHLMREIAYWFYTTPSTGGGLDEKVLTKVISQFMRDSLGFDQTDAERTARDFLDFCAERLWLLARVGSSPGGVRIFNFTHRTFYEYFAADSMARRFTDDRLVADRIIDSYMADGTSVLPELLIQAYDAHRERGAANVYDQLCALRAPVDLLLRLMEGALLPAFARKAAFDLMFRAYELGEFPPSACRSLFALTSSARKQLVDNYLLDPDNSAGRALILDAWASSQLGGRWTGRTIQDWLPLIEDVLTRFSPTERDLWGAPSIANWLVVLGESAVRSVNDWEYLVFESLAGWVPGAVWWYLDARFGREQAINEGAPVERIAAVLLARLVRGDVVPDVLLRTARVLNGLAVDQIPWDLTIDPMAGASSDARNLITALALAMQEVGSNTLYMAITTNSKSNLEALVSERERRMGGFAGELMPDIEAMLSDLPPVFRHWALADISFCGRTDSG